jgi:lipopolysaccharide exporter
MEIKDRLKSDSLGARCIKACSWVTLGSVTNQFIIRGGRLLILTYLLVPEEMHLVVLVWSVLGLLQEFTDTGIKHAIIQNSRGLEEEYAGSAWLMNVARGGVLIALMYFMIPPLAEYVYDNTPLSRLLKLSCLIIAFDSLTSISMVLMRKKLKFAAVTIITIAGHAIGAGATILLTIRLEDARGVVLGEAVTSLTICILSYVVLPYRLRWCWSSRAARELIGYGSIAYLVTLIDALGNRMDVLILAKIAQDTEVAIYGLGMIAIQAPCHIFALLTVTVGFPALSMIQHDKGAMRKVITEIVLATQIVSMPLFVVIALLAPDIVKILPDKYTGTGEVIRWLSIYGFSAVFLRQMTPVLYAINRVIWCVARALMQVIIIAVLIVPLYQYKGLVGVCWTKNVALIITDIFIWVMVLRELKWPWRQWFKDISMLSWAILAGAGAWGSVYGILSVLGYEWTGHFWARWFNCLAGVAVFVIVGVRYYRRRNNFPGKT